MINLKNSKNEKIKSIPTGFSVTSFLFGPFVPLFRGDFKFLIIGLFGLLFLVSCTQTEWVQWKNYPSSHCDHTDQFGDEEYMADLQVDANLLGACGLNKRSTGKAKCDGKKLFIECKSY